MPDVNQARGGILFIPRIEGSFGGPFKAEFPTATLDMQKAIIDQDPVIVGTTTQVDYNERLSSASGIADHVQVKRVPEPSEDDAIEIIKVIVPHIASEYNVGISEDAFKTAVKLAKRHMSTPLPRSAEHLMHRAAAMVNVNRQDANTEGSKPSKGVVDTEEVTPAAAEITGVPAPELGQEGLT